jgi:site-specific DNA-methyltransferase (adenine-specific)
MKEEKSLKIEYLNIDDIKPYDKNARKHTNFDVDKIADSISQFGFNDPIGVWGKENLIVEGHGRLMAAKKLGFDKVPVIRLDELSDEERKAYALAHNQTALNSDWDFDLLNSEIHEISDIDMSKFGFDMAQFEEETPDAVEDDYDIDQAVPSKVKSGEVWVLGAHRLMCGDSTKAEDVSKLVGGGSEKLVNLYITDPPYNIDYTGKTKDALKISNDKMDESSFRQFLSDSFSAADSVMKPGAAFYIWHADSEGYNFRGACEDIGWKVRECLIWSKDLFTLGRQDYQWQHEPCLYGWSEGSHKWYSDRKQTTVLEFDRPKRSEMHPTMKPVPLFDYLIKNSSNKGDIVLDSFGGSGTTIIACEQNGRRGYLMEIDPKYCDVIIDRWESLTGQKAVREDD